MTQSKSNCLHGLTARMDATPVVNNKKPKIAIIHFSGPPMISGVDVMMKDQARLFRLFNYKVEIVAGIGRQFRKDIPVHIIRRINPSHPLVLSVRKELEQGVVSPAFYQLEKSLYNTMKKYITEHHIDVVILHNLYTRYYNLALTSALTRIMKELPDVKFAAWVHDMVFYDDPYVHLDKKLAEHYPWSLLVHPVAGLSYVCVSEFLKDNLLSAFGNEKPTMVTVIPNVHDIPKFFGLTPIMRRFYEEIDGLGSDLIACIPVRAVPRKNLELAIRIARAMVDRGVNFKLVMTANVDYKRVENQRYYEMLKKMVVDLSLREHVFFLEEYFEKFKEDSVVPPVPIPELYQISDFLLMTSRLEGFGLPLLEAGLLRCPIFASDIAPFREIGTTNINYFSLSDEPGTIADFILEQMKTMPQAYFYRKVIKNYSLHTTFRTTILPLIDRLVTS